VSDTATLPTLDPATSTPAGAPVGAVERTVASPFGVIVDTREQLAYTFADIRANADQKHARVIVPTTRVALDVGDYSIVGLANLITIERKSKDDLYSSIGQRRENFEARLRKMCCDYSMSAVVVEAEWSSIMLDPPGFSRFHPKALARTIFAWMVRWPRVHWVMMPDRATAETATYRLMERFWWAYTEGKTFQQEWYREWEAAGWPGLSKQDESETFVPN
jgi:ERCC4-type nuclease